MYEIKENERAGSNCDWRFYVKKNGKVIREQMTLKEAKKYIELMKEWHKQK